MLLLALATANPTIVEADVSTIYIWGDRFQRWRDTRWLVETDFILPTGLTLMSQENVDVLTTALQIEAVLHCDPEHERKRMQVGCTVEDIALRAATARRWRTPRDLEIVQEVLDEIDASLTGATLQLQVDANGAVRDVDLEGLRNGSRRERIRAGSLRHIAGRIAAAYHLELPAEIRAGQWLEEDSLLMRMPSKRASIGNSELVSVLSPYDGHLLVQQKGRGVVGLRPIESSERQLPGLDKTLTDEQTEYLQGIPGGTGNTQLGSEMAKDLLFKLTMDGVSLFDPDTGILRERVWSVRGTPSASTLLQQEITYTGSLRLLEEGEQVAVGASLQVGYPGLSVGTLPPWVPLTTGR